MSNTYLWIKAIHIFGVVIFLGNIIVTGWWKVMADRTKNPQIIAYAQRQVTLTDYIFTAGGSLILIVAGLSNVILFKMNFNSQWLMQGLLMFGLSGLIWVTILIPTQIKQAKMVSQFDKALEIPDAYWRLCKRWNIYGAIAVLLPLVNLYWMTFKPN